MNRWMGWAGGERDDWRLSGARKFLLGWFIAAPWLFLAGAAAAAEIASFQAGSGGWHLGALAGGNLDGDAPLEIVVPYRGASGHWFFDAFKAKGTRPAGFPFAGGSEEINVSPTLFDLDGGGRGEIIFTH